MVRFFWAFVVGLVHASTINIRGEPKSGTTWFGTLFEHLAAELCKDGCSLDHPKQPKKRRDDVDLTLKRERGDVHITTAMKHVVPGTVGCANTSHPNTIIHLKPPCALNESSGAAAVEACAAACREQGGATGRRIGDTAHVHRDPRAVVVSGCYHLRKQADLDGCVREMYATTALWVRFRQAWFVDGSSTAAAGATLDVAYEDLVACPLEPLRRMATILGFPSAPDAALTRAHKAAGKDRTKHRAHTDSYRDGLAPATLAWMDAIHADLRFSRAYVNGSCNGTAAALSNPASEEA